MLCSPLVQYLSFEFDRPCNTVHTGTPKRRGETNYEKKKLSRRIWERGKEELILFLGDDLGNETG